MGSEIVYCTVCGDRILEREFREGHALTVWKRNYCPKCSVNVKVEMSPVLPAARKPRTTRMPKADLPPRLKISTPFILAIGIGIIVLIMIVIVVARS